MNLSEIDLDPKNSHLLSQRTVELYATLSFNPALSQRAAFDVPLQMTNKEEQIFGAINYLSFNTATYLIEKNRVNFDEVI